ncbi:zinc finger and BTB domain-containing protein 17-like [Wyeomyia smithii]|uniref:zinc finger and BTB domain-containing protein 17-like n=1 Tax=Wyeomyia smithii TaxID=174621 RepID=UPI002467CF8C|nr:zinc finger and BTB domain-containing protein 17-like [Wyeomyia smithii]
MENSWINWCRLCASEQTSWNLESLDELNKIIVRHLNFSLQEISNAASSVCNECYSFVYKLDSFRKRYQQTHRMLLELYSMKDTDLSEIKLGETRFRFLEDSTEPMVKEEDVFPETVAWAADACLGTSAPEEDTEFIFTAKDEVKLDVIKRKKKSRVSSDSKIDRLSDNESSEGRLSPAFSTQEDSADDVSDFNPDFEIDDKPAKAYKRKTRPKSKTSPEKKRVPKPRPKCEPCDSEFRHRSAYLQHLETKHSQSEELLFPCASCPKRFASARRQKEHAETHLPPELKMIHPCRFCDKKFSKMTSVVTHIKAIHAGERPYICEECGKDFSTKGWLKEHQTSHSDERHFLCPQCPKAFKNMPALKIHIDTHSDTQYVCPQCGLRLNTKRTLRRHMVVHSDQKRFKCQYCGNEFKRSKTLKNHLMLHTGYRPYKCPFCEKSFASGPNCRQHKKSAHPEELAALEASGHEIWASNVPKLEQLQPKNPAITD